METSKPRSHAQEFFQASREHYPDERGFEALEAAWEASGRRERFVKLSQRDWTYSPVHPWIFSARARPETFSYRGLIFNKNPLDLALYTRLIWELQPRTIIEFGSLHGGSALWFADQLSALCGTGEVHSFDKFDKRVSAHAKHPLLRFHHADLMDLRTLDPGLFETFPHPWLISEDAHVNPLELLVYLDRFMRPGDYYVKEDTMLYLDGRHLPMLAQAVGIIDRAGLMVDTSLTDAFDKNLTSAVNFWMRKFDVTPGK